jgi:hypothetical protein
VLVECRHRVSSTFHDEFRPPTILCMHEAPASNDTWSHYSALRDHFIGLVRPLDDAQLGTTVPMCPAWTVKDVAAHVCGLNDDLTGGITEGLGSDQRTAHHVSLRSTATIGEIRDEWLGYDSEMSAICAQTPLWATRLAADLTVHLHDVQHALGLPIDRNDRFTAVAAHQYTGVFQQRVRDILGLGITVELTDGARREADPALPHSGVALRATPFDFLRSFTGRRSRHQVESLDWTGDPTRIFDEAWSPYGTFQPDAVED